MQPPVLLAPPPPAEAPNASIPLIAGMTDDQRLAHAREVASFFRNGKDSRRATDLWREMLLVHLDGSGDGQYAIILDGSYVSIPWAFGRKLRVQWNLLRPITANMVKHHTAIPYRCTVEMSGSRRQRKQARAAQAYGNHFIQDQRLNALVAEALWMGAPYGHCPIHLQWRQDLTHEPYHPVYLTGEDAEQYMNVMRRGFTDAYVGDPWNTVYNDGAKRTSVHRMCYARSLPLSLVKNSFPRAPGIERLKGRTDLPSASRHQQAVRRAMMQAGTGTHGSSAKTGGMKSEEIVVILCDEIPPGVDPQWPLGRLSICALDGVASVDENPRAADPLWLHTGALPGARFSAMRIYANDSMDDVLGHPFLADLDEMQVSLNQLATMRRERIRRFARTQLLAQSGSLEDDSLITVDDAILYYTGQQPSFLTPPTAEVGLIDNDIRDTMETMFRVGGWQSASRGEGKAGDSGAKVAILKDADDSIFASSNRLLQEEVALGLQTACALAKRFMVLPTPLKTTGTDLSYLGEITKEDLPDEPPTYTLTQGSASPEARLQQNLNLVTTKGADEKPLMTTEQFHESNPDPSLRPVMSEVARLRRIRPIQVADAIEEACATLVAKYGEIPPQAMEMVAQQVFVRIWQEWPIEPGEDPQLNLDALDELILDETVHKLAKSVARLRRRQVAQWQAEMLAYQQMFAQGGNAQAGAEMGGNANGGGAQPQQRQIGPYTNSPSTMEFENRGGRVDRMTATATA